MNGSNIGTNSNITSGRNPPSNCTLLTTTVIAMQGHQTKEDTIDLYNSSVCSIGFRVVWVSMKEIDYAYIYIYIYNNGHGCRTVHTHK